MACVPGWHEGNVTSAEDTGRFFEDLFHLRRYLLFCEVEISEKSHKSFFLPSPSFRASDTLIPFRFVATVDTTEDLSNPC